ncbi:proline dehydrogenase family protein [Sphingobium sp. AP49]|uniref:proline dehydrogenase family protein n=1 Tax=Sphingobium sp. AP49 TaxID=1144307 RepID=UPI001EE64FF5|nr:proline dehydrogenase family protein [Sphingobium sp. AP49]WHO40371.1 proline dehydrogenase family protein [Sphingobium sp. AP49]
MKRSRIWRMLRDLRYGLPGLVGRSLPILDGLGAVTIGRRAARSGRAITIGYFEAEGEDPDNIVLAYHRALAAWRDRPFDLYLSVKAPPLAFAFDRLHALAAAARAAGCPLMFDAHGPDQADRTLALVERLLPDFPGTGCVLPARWHRSFADAARFRDTTAPLRIVAGEWPDPERDEPDIDRAYAMLVESLAGRRAPVAVATHRPARAAQALAALQRAGTPCELEQLRGLPGRRCRTVAARLDVPVRLYVPFGPGWLPYALDRALARPYLAAWLLRDGMGRADP